MGHYVLTQEMATLSKMLQTTMIDSQAFVNAVNLGYIEVRDGGLLRWNLGSKTLLAYFCGKLWCGDKGVYSKRKKTKVWHKGSKNFPATELQRLFGSTTLKKLRQKRTNMVLPDHFDVIDNLFSA